MEFVRTAFTLTDETLSKLDELCESNGDTSRSAMLRKLIKDAYCATNPAEAS